MTLQDLYDQVVPSFTLSVQKDVKTAIRVLAEALDCSDPQHCTPEQYNRPLPSLCRLVETSLLAQGKSAHTLRNTKNTIRRLFRLAEEKQLFSLVPQVPTPHYDLDTKPLRPGSITTRRNGTYLVYKDWSPDLQQAFQTFATWATAPVVPDRPANLQKRLSTIDGYCESFQAYFGFLHHIQHIPPSFEDLFALDRVTAYVYWHINDLHKSPTHAIRGFLTRLLALTRQYRLLPDLRAQLVVLKNTIPIPQLVYAKEDAWVSRSTLQEIGRSLWPHKPPEAFFQGRYPGLRSAVRAGLSLMLQLWSYIPYRQRNMREMELDKNLHKDKEGKWQITFAGTQLKIASKGGKLNIFTVPFPEKLVPILEDYLQVWRPILVQKVAQSTLHVFLTQYGTPYTMNGLGLGTSKIVYRYTGKHWHPHNIRTVWATEFIREHKDFYKAAYMLNDNLDMVIKTYTHLLQDNVAEEVYQLLDT